MALMERCYSLREGYIPLRDDGLPDRFFDETIQTKYGVPLKLDRDKFMQQKDTWYSARGLTAEGLPKVADLERLGLGFAVPVVEKASGKKS
ncbi:MAG: aldehyde ferredoxin oxidoreductase C-terminal domain-containing protein, partial [Dehalococcoidia bacterium]|nr:aldehyde ferredoxin oxidoreductase C-terminal domain-containing protein [Dehalococcoidia bacterium]